MTRPPAVRVPSTRTVDMRARLESKAIAAPSGCLIWVAAVDGKGYGLVRQPGYLSMRPSHRVAWELANGQEIPRDRHVDHLCRNKKCINPQHLDVVTPRENILRAGNPGERITRVLTGRQSRKQPDAAVFTAMREFAASLGSGLTPDVATGAVYQLAPVADRDEPRHPSDPAVYGRGRRRINGEQP